MSQKESKILNVYIGEETGFLMFLIKEAEMSDRFVVRNVLVDGNKTIHFLGMIFE